MILHLRNLENKVDLGNNKVLIGQTDEEIENVIREFNRYCWDINFIFKLKRVRTYNCKNCQKNR